MAIKKGTNVVIAKNLGPSNGKDSDDYYFSEYTGYIELGSKGIVSRVEGNRIYIIPENMEGEYPFHKNELKFPEMNNAPLSKIPQQYIFDLASQMPIFLINDRVYYPGNSSENLKSNFFQGVENGTFTKKGLVESATLASLEELAMAHNAGEYTQIEKKYLQEIVEENSITEDNNSARLVSFIMNEVFPYFRNEGPNTDKINNLLGIKTDKREYKNEGPKVKKQEEQEIKDSFISKVILDIEKEKFKISKIKETKLNKLDTLLGYFTQEEVTSPNQDYNSSSVLGEVLGGRNVAIINNVVYTLVPTKDKSQAYLLNLNKKNFTLVSPRSIDELKAKYDFELSKKIRINALKNKLAKDEQLNELIQKNGNIKALTRRREYDEGDFGFIKEDCLNDDEAATYWVFLKVPKHVLKMPDDYKLHYNDDDYDDNGNLKKSAQKKNRYYLFDKVRVALRVFINEQGKISYNSYPKTVEDYDHPFSMESGDFGPICLGHYSFNKLSKLKPGEAVARLLTDTKGVLLSGYTRGSTGAAQPLDKFEDKRITLSEIKKRNLPITNINLGKGRTRR